MMTWQHLITLRNDHIGDRPSNRQRGIIKAKASSQAWHIGGRDLVINLGVVDQRLKTVRKAFRYIEHQMVVGAQFFAVPLTVGWRVLAQIHHHIEDGAAGTTHDLGFEMRRCLKMHASKSSSARIQRNRTLNEISLKTASAKFLRAKSARKRSTPIPNKLGFDTVGSVQLQRMKQHENLGDQLACRTRVQSRTGRTAPGIP